MSKLYAYEFVFEENDGSLSNVHTVMSENWRDAMHAIDIYRPSGKLAVFQGANPNNYSDPNKVKVGRDKVVEHPIAAIIPNWPPRSSGTWITSG